MPNPPFRSYRHLAAHLIAIAFALVAGLAAIQWAVSFAASIMEGTPA